MNTANISERVSQLEKRKEKIASTLQHLAGEQAEIEKSIDWIDRAACESRIQMFDRLNEWYLHELREIEDALDRISEDKYGRCLACHNSIETSRLDFFPQAAFCSACQS